MLLTRAIVLGLLIAVGSFAIDMYIPGFAAITRDFRTDQASVQMTMTAYFVSLAAGQLFYGPLSDAFGRKRPIYLGLCIFALASAAAAFAPTIGTLITARFVQGLGAAATMVIPLAIIRDQHSGPDAARLMSLAGLSRSISPILAPAFGGALVQLTSWRVIFGGLVVVGLLGVLVTRWALPETLPRSRRIAMGPARLAATYRALILDRRFIVPLVVAGFAQCVLMAFVTGSPFIFVTLFHLTPVQYGVVFALHAGMLILVSQFNAPAMRLFGTDPLVLWCTVVFSVLALALLAYVLTGLAPQWPFVALTLAMFACVGLFSPPAFLAAMEPFDSIAGAAAAIGVAIQLCMCSLTTFLLAMVSDGTARPMAALMALAACLSLSGWVSFRHGLVLKMQP